MVYADTFDQILCYQLSNKLASTVGNESVSCNSLASSEQGRCYQLFDAPACILVLHSYFIVITA